jgi:hypothetical protein
MRTNITNGLQTVTTTGPVAPSGGADVSQVNANYTLRMRIISLTSASFNPGGVRIVIEESNNNFGTVSPLRVVDVAYSVNRDVLMSWRPGDMCQSLIGTAGALLRANVYDFNNFGGASATFEVWLDS